MPGRRRYKRGVYKPVSKANRKGVRLLGGFRRLEEMEMQADYIRKFGVRRIPRAWGIYDEFEELTCHICDMNG